MEKKEDELALINSHPLDNSDIHEKAVKRKSILWESE